MKYISSIVFVGGNAPRNPILNWDCVLCIVADKGIRNCKNWNYEPQYVIGDFDSITKEKAIHMFPNVELVSFSREKNNTDTELALMYAYNWGANDITLIGGEGGERVDHFIEILTFYNKSHPPHRIITTTQQIEYISEGCVLRLQTKKDKIISIFSVGKGGSSQKTKGLYWNLDDITLSTEKTSISNRATCDSVEIAVYRGNLIVIWEHENCVQRPAKSYIKY